MFQNFILQLLKNRFSPKNKVISGLYPIAFITHDGPETLEVRNNKFARIRITLMAWSVELIESFSRLRNMGSRQVNRLVIPQRNIL